MENLVQGDCLIVDFVVVLCEECLILVIVEDFLLFGFEIEVVVWFEDVGNIGVYFWFDNICMLCVVEVCDDCFVVVFDLCNWWAERIVYVVRVVTLGSYILFGVVVEDMYWLDTFVCSVIGCIVIVL